MTTQYPFEPTISSSRKVDDEEFDDEEELPDKFQEFLTRYYEDLRERHKDVVKHAYVSPVKRMTRDRN